MKFNIILFIFFSVCSTAHSMTEQLPVEQSLDILSKQLAALQTNLSNLNTQLHTLHTKIVNPIAEQSSAITPEEAALQQARRLLITQELDNLSKTKSEAAQALEKSIEELRSRADQELKSRKEAEKNLRIAEETLQRLHNAQVSVEPIQMPQQTEHATPPLIIPNDSDSRTLQTPPSAIAQPSAEDFLKEVLRLSLNPKELLLCSQLQTPNSSTLLHDAVINNFHEILKHAEIFNLNKINLADKAYKTKFPCYVLPTDSVEIQAKKLASFFTQDKQLPIEYALMHGLDALSTLLPTDDFDAYSELITTTLIPSSEDCARWLADGYRLKQAYQQFLDDVRTYIHQQQRLASIDSPSISTAMQEQKFYQDAYAIFNRFNTLLDTEATTKPPILQMPITMLGFFYHEAPSGISQSDSLALFSYYSYLIGYRKPLLKNPTEDEKQESDTYVLEQLTSLNNTNYQQLLHSLKLSPTVLHDSLLFNGSPTSLCGIIGLMANPGMIKKDLEQELTKALKAILYYPDQHTAQLGSITSTLLTFMRDKQTALIPELTQTLLDDCIATIASTIRSYKKFKDAKLYAITQLTRTILNQPWKNKDESTIIPQAQALVDALNANNFDSFVGDTPAYKTIRTKLTTLSKQDAETDVIYTMATTIITTLNQRSYATREAMVIDFIQACLEHNSPALNNLMAKPLAYLLSALPTDQFTKFFNLWCSQNNLPTMILTPPSSFPIALLTDVQTQLKKDVAHFFKQALGLELKKKPEAYSTIAQQLWNYLEQRDFLAITHLLAQLLETDYPLLFLPNHMFDRFFDKIPLPQAPQKPVPTNVVNSSALPAIDLTDAKFNKYRNMQKAGLPEGAIRQKMNAEGITQPEIDAFFNPSQPSIAAPLAPAIDITDAKFDKYRNMQKAGLPEGAIRQKMKTDGITQPEIDTFFNPTQSSIAAPTPVESDSPPFANLNNPKFTPFLTLNPTQEDTVTKLQQTLSPEEFTLFCTPHRPLFAALQLFVQHTPQRTQFLRLITENRTALQKQLIAIQTQLFTIWLAQLKQTLQRINGDRNTEYPILFKLFNDDRSFKNSMKKYFKDIKILGIVKEPTEPLSPIETLSADLFKSEPIPFTKETSPEWAQTVTTLFSTPYQQLASLAQQPTKPLDAYTQTYTKPVTLAQRSRTWAEFLQDTQAAIRSTVHQLGESIGLSSDEED